MPQQGQKTITIKDDVYEVAVKNADRQKRSIANYVSKLILEDK